jgi:hypothetical protein
MAERAGFVWLMPPDADWPPAVVLGPSRRLATPTRRVCTTSPEPAGVGLRAVVAGRAFADVRVVVFFEATFFEVFALFVAFFGLAFAEVFFFVVDAAFRVVVFFAPAFAGLAFLALVFDRFAEVRAAMRARS